MAGAELPLSARVVPLPDVLLPVGLAFSKETERMHGLGGLIIASFAQDVPQCYYTEIGTWQLFDSTRAESPYLFRTRRVMKTLARLRKDPEVSGAINMALWIHPEYYARPNAKYIDLKGRFPGNPRQ